MVVCVALALGGCQTMDDADPADEEAPELPSVSTMQANLGGVEQAPQQAKSAAPDGGSVYTNFANAWVRVNVVRLYGVGIVLIPAASMGLALGQEPVFQGGAWTWSVTVLGITGDLALTGNFVAGWDVAFRVTSPTLGLTRFLWIEGHFAGDLGSGFWLAHDPKLPAGNDDVLEISWTYTSETSHSLAYSNVNQSSPDVGDVITYALAGTTATLVYDDASDPAVVADITWDTATGVGSIQVPGYAGGVEACWNSAFENAACE